MAIEKKAGSREYQKMLVRMLKAYPRRVVEDGLDPDALTQLREIQDELDRQTGETVARLREDGYTWTQIADGLGTTKSAAIRKYGSLPVDEAKVRKAGAQPGELR